MLSMFQSGTNCLDAFESLEITCRKMISRFVLCLRNKWSIYWWANDGDWTRAWWIHNPLPWSTWLHPPLPPHRFQSLSTIRSFLNPPMTAIKEKLFYSCKSIVGKKSFKTSRSFLEKLQRLGCSLHWFDFTLLKIQDGGRADSEGSFSRQQASSKLRLWRAYS